MRTNDKLLIQTIESNYSINLLWNKIPEVRLIYIDKLQTESFVNQLTLETVKTFIRHLPELKAKWQEMGFSSDNLKPTEGKEQLLKALKQTLVKGSVLILKNADLKKATNNRELTAMETDTIHLVRPIKKTLSKRLFFNKISSNIREIHDFYGDNSRPIRKR